MLGLAQRSRKIQKPLFLSVLHMAPFLVFGYLRGTEYYVYHKSCLMCLVSTSIIASHLVLALLIIYKYRPALVAATCFTLAGLGFLAFSGLYTPPIYDSVERILVPKGWYPTSTSVPIMLSDPINIKSSDAMIFIYSPGCDHCVQVAATIPSNLQDLYSRYLLNFDTMPQSLNYLIGDATALPILIEPAGQ